MFLLSRLPPRSTLFPYTTLFRSISKSSTSTTRVAPGGSSDTGQMSTVGLKSSRSPTFVVGNTSRSVARARSEEHTSELQSHSDLVCRLLLEKKNSTASANGGISD